MATVVLKMSEVEFWNCTHKKLLALIKIDKEIKDKQFGNSAESIKEEEYIDNINL